MNIRGFRATWLARDACETHFVCVFRVFVRRESMYVVWEEVGASQSKSERRKELNVDPKPKY